MLFDGTQPLRMPPQRRTPRISPSHVPRWIHAQRLVKAMVKVGLSGTSRSQEKMLRVSRSMLAAEAALVMLLSETARRAPIG